MGHRKLQRPSIWTYMETVYCILFDYLFSIANSEQSLRGRFCCCLKENDLSFDR